jgi:hypothetical protein
VRLTHIYIALKDLIWGDIMGKVCSETYTNAGILKKTGTGLVMDIAGAEFFLFHGDLDALTGNRMATIFTSLGEPGGVAYLSPLSGQTKKEMTSVISPHIYSVPYRRFSRVMNGSQKRTILKEYHPRQRMAT